MTQDVRFAARLLLKQPYFTMVAVLTMALGMGVSAALFSIIDAAVLRPLPYPNPEQLVTVDVRVHYRDREPSTYAPSMQDIRTWRELGTVFSHIGAGRVSGFTKLIVDTGEPERLTVASASEDFLETYGIVPLLGRGISIDDTREGALDVALLGHAYWRTRFGADPNVVGRTIRIENEPATIIGVLPSGFYAETAVWRAQEYPTARIARRGSGTPVVGRMKSGVTIAQAAPLLDRVTTPGERSTSAAVVMQSLYDDETSGYWSTLRTLASAVGLLLLIACVNVAGLLVARGFTRQPELAIRASLGATRARLVRQMLTESLLLAMAGSIVGLAVAWAALDSLVALIPLRLPPNSPVRINAAVLASTLLLSIASATLSGLAPALWLSRRKSLSSAASANRAAGTAMSARLGHLLVAGEVALALILLAGSGLLIRSFARLVAVDLGYDPAAILTMAVEPLDRSAAVRHNYYQALTRALSELPEVAAAGAIDQLALTGGGTYMFPKADNGAMVEGPYRTVLPGYFESLGVRPRAGRLFTDADLRAGEAVIVNARSAVRYFPDGAIGHTLQTSGKLPRTLRIIGVVPDLRHSGPSWRGEPEMYALPDPHTSDTPGPLAIVMRARDGATIPRERIVAAANAVGPRVLVGEILAGSEILDTQVATPKQRMLLLSLLGGFGLFLTLVGIFGVTASAVARRTREIGVRLALGASPRRVVRAVARDIVVPIAIGLVAGLAGAQAATKLVAGFLFETTPHDPMTFTVIAALVAVAAGLAAWIPARRAAAVDPIVALRTE